MMIKDRNELLRQSLKEIESKKGYVKPQDLVHVARPESSPLHDLFEWDSEMAAEKYRIWQARTYIVEVKVDFNGRESQQYWHAKVEIKNEEVEGYFSLGKVLSNKKLHSQVLADALSELEYWQKKYREVSELKGIVDIKKIETLKQQI